MLRLCWNCVCTSGLLYLHRLCTLESPTLSFRGVRTRKLGGAQRPTPTFLQMAINSAMAGLKNSRTDMALHIMSVMVRLAQSISPMLMMNKSECRRFLMDGILTMSSMLRQPASSGEKICLLFIATAQKPWCFLKKQGGELGFWYFFNMKTWMTGEIFTQAMDVNKMMKQQN